ncbi:hypothetical protein AOLI_G00120920 [Acnodon oligacanthus]
MLNVRDENPSDFKTRAGLPLEPKRFLRKHFNQRERVRINTEVLAVEQRELSHCNSAHQAEELFSSDRHILDPLISPPMKEAFNELSRLAEGWKSVTQAESS